jgi:hypothetical protein
LNVGPGNTEIQTSEFIRQFPHTSDCIVTKARQLIERRKNQPSIEEKS